MLHIVSLYYMKGVQVNTMRRIVSQNGNPIMYLGAWDVQALRMSRKYVDSRIFEEGSIKNDFKEESGEYAITFPENIEAICKMKFIIDRRTLDVLPLKDVRHHMGDTDKRFKEFKRIIESFEGDETDKTLTPDDSSKLVKYVDLVNIYALEDFFVEGQKPKAERTESFAEAAQAMQAEFNCYLNSLLEYVFIRAKKEKEDGPFVSTIKRHVLSMKYERENRKKK